MKDNLRQEMSLPFIFTESEGVNVSFEFFPPKSENMEDTLWQSINVLAPMKPNFVSVTYGAGGTTKEATQNIVKEIKRETNLNVAAHLTCVGASKSEIKDIADQYWEEGIKHIVALRGDLPKGHNQGSDGYKYANELVADLKSFHDFEISVGGYPEKHPEASSMEEDLKNLKRKIDAGADRVISQFFIEPKLFIDFHEKARDIGITVPIVPGILPITNFDGAVKFAKLCGTSIPQWLHSLFSGLDEHQQQTKQIIGATVAAEQCRVLYEHGVRDFHFYTLNKAELTLAICHMLGKRV